MTELPHLRFRDRLACAHCKGEITGDDAFRLMVLWSRARSDCHLRGKREGHDSYYDAHQLAGFFGVTERTFFTWWQRWKDNGWVDSERPEDRGRLRRWLVAERTGSE